MHRTISAKILANTFLQMLEDLLRQSPTTGAALNDATDATTVLIATIIEIRFSIAEELSPKELIDREQHEEIIALTCGDLNHLIASRVARLQHDAREKRDASNNR